MAEFETGRLEQALDHLRLGVEAARSASPELQFQTTFALFVREADFQSPEESLQRLTGLRQLAARNGDASSLAGLHLAVARLDGSRGHIFEARRHIATASRLAARFNLPRLSCLAALVEASIESLAGSPSNVHRLATSALEWARQLNDVRFELHANSLLALASLQAGQLSSACELAGVVVDRSRALVPVHLAALDTLAGAQLANGQADAASETLAQCEVVAPRSKVGRLWNDLETDISKCLVAEELGRWREVVDIVNRTEPETRRRAQRALRTSLLCAKARALAHLNDLEAAEALLSVATKVLPPACLEQLVAVHVSRGVCNQARGARASASQHFDRAQTIARATGRKHLEHWASKHRGHSPRTDSTVALDIGRTSPASLERTVTTVGDLYEPAAPIELVAERIVAVLADTPLGRRTTIIQTTAARVSGLEVDWKSSNGAFGIELREMNRAVSVSVSPVNDIDEISLLMTIANTVQTALRERGSNDGRDLWPASKPLVQDQRVFQSTRMIELLDTAGRLAAARLPVLVTGETGTGKEVLARLIHEQGQVRSGPFVPFNCSALPRELVESQLFGHRKGAFTGAVDSQIGIIRSAEGGTLFLDELGDLDPVVQPKLLRFLESGEIQPVGEPRSRQVSVRIIAATNVDLEELVRQGRFREDLYYRIGVAPVLIPPLRERKDEIPTLAALFLELYGRECERRGVRFSDECVAALLLYDWPGNIRQLANEVRRVVAMATDGQIVAPQHLAPQIARVWRDRPAIQEPPEQPTVSVGMNQDLASAIAELEEKLIEHVLDVTGGHVSEAAKLLGLSRKGLFLKRRRRGLLRDQAV